ncbi:hypothetical protein IFM89_008751 [Coptis chinensis]|uniref:Uncharacterized protein n=1 Tax=Coptis chinensis TaxID=261450 RepID=A0A835HLC3_9MAGN|nr:hypothetical protein IFM89_008751 [Coptis chinensis]
MIDCDIVGGNWIEVPVGKYKKVVRTMSYCQLEFDYCILMHREIGEAIKVNEKCPNALSMLGALELKNDDWLKAKETFRAAAARKATDGKDSYYALSLVGIVYGKEIGTTLLPPVQDCLENRIEICNPS